MVISPFFFLLLVVRELAGGLIMHIDDVENQQLRSSSVWMDDGNGFVQG